MPRDPTTFCWRWLGLNLSSVDMEGPGAGLALRFLMYINNMPYLETLQLNVARAVPDAWSVLSPSFNALEKEGIENLIGDEGYWLPPSVSHLEVDLSMVEMGTAGFDAFLGSVAQHSWLRHLSTQGRNLGRASLRHFQHLQPHGEL